MKNTPDICSILSFCPFSLYEYYQSNQSEHSNSSSQLDFCQGSRLWSNSDRLQQFTKMNFVTMSKRNSSRAKIEVFGRTEIQLIGFLVVLKYRKGCSENVRNFICIFIKSILKKCFKAKIQYLNVLAQRSYPTFLEANFKLGIASPTVVAMVNKSYCVRKVR